MATNDITQRLLIWHEKHGRHSLPWQNTQDAYRIWLSEIMLQQTQVATVIPYYQRFLESFPTVIDLANAEQDKVLHHWTGLGYYARARNLHKTSQIVRDQYKGIFPTQFEQMIALPGIGKSTAGAILAFSENQHHAILDGNVKRVLARFYAIEGWYGKKEVEKQLWAKAQANTPKKQVAKYTQAIMDLGATVCTRSKPNCATCPLMTDCQAFTTERTTELPHSKPKKDKPVKHTIMLFIKNQLGEIMLRKNPPSGIWGGLWCPPQLDAAQEQINEQIELPPYRLKVTHKRPTFRHTFSHYHLDISPVVCKVNHVDGVAEANEVWYKFGSDQALGLAAPVKKLLQLEADE